ncbi:hypothetical protein GF312_03955 [Candidatus Poribacteria bacterium]|nr:hypothetical protein [Candidatus Poribacteria bacterium]
MCKGIRKTIIIYLIIAFCFLPSILFSFKSDIYADEIIRVDPQSTGQMQPRVFEDRIVWEDIRDGTSQIYIHDISTGETYPLDPTDSIQTWSSVYSDSIVWQDYRNGYYQIYYYDLSDPATDPIRISATTSDQLYPGIYGDNIVWVDTRDGVHQIYMYSITAETVTRIDPTDYLQTTPEIYEDRIVWADFRPGYLQIYLYDIAADNSTILYPSPNDQRDPSIWEDRIVWVEHDAAIPTPDTPANIKLHDLSSGNTSVISPSSSNQMQPAISGKYVIWLDDRDGQWQVYLMDLMGFSGSSRINPSDELQDYPDISGNRVVWSDWRDLGNYPQTYLYDFPLQMQKNIFGSLFERLKYYLSTIIGIIFRIADNFLSSPQVPDNVKGEAEIENNGDKEIKEEDSQDDSKKEDILKEKEQEKETTGKQEQAIEPAIKLEIYEGPIYSEEDNVCYYRVKAIVTGKPLPDIEFSRDDSNGAWGNNRAQVNLYDLNDSYTLTAVAANRAGTATDVIELCWECDVEEQENDYQPAAAEYGIAFGIDYANPNKYLIQGKQSKISDHTILKTLYSNKKNLDNLGNIYHWLKDEFTSYSAGGKTIGKVTAEELLEKMSLGGCHDYALVYSAVAREIGYPAVMIRTSSIVWIKSFKTDEEEARPRIGHVFVEVYLDNRWILIDPTNGWYFDEGYDPANPVIPLRGNIAGQTEEIYGFYVEKKGFDIWDMGIYNQLDSGISMDEMARRVNLDSIVYPDYNFKRFSEE